MTISPRLRASERGRLLRAAVATGACLAATLAAAATPSDEAAVRARAAALVARMTLDEEGGQLLNVAPAIERLGIPAYNWWTESLHGAIGPVATTNFPE